VAVDETGLFFVQLKRTFQSSAADNKGSDTDAGNWPDLSYALQLPLRQSFTGLTEQFFGQR
jgi:hypothetical protein